MTEMTPDPAHDETDTLIWAYLDGEIEPGAVDTLSAMLTERAEVRERFVESAVMHGMLIEHYREADAKISQQYAARHEEQFARRKRLRHGRPPAA